MTRRAIITLLVALSPCHALTPSPCVAGEAASAPVSVRGRVVARLYTANAGLSPAERAELATKRLAALGAGPIPPTAIETRPLKESVGLYLRGELLLVATPAEAATRALTPAALADRWATLLRKVLGAATPSPKHGGGREGRSPNPLSFSGRGQGEGSKPPPALRLSETNVTVPLGETRAVTVVGSGAGPGVETAGIEVIDAQLEPGRQPGTWALRLRGLTAGRAVVRLRPSGSEGKPAGSPTSGARPTATPQAGAAPAELTVRVMPYAARLQEPIEVAVTGRPAPAAWVRQQALARRDETVIVAPGGSVQWSPAEGARGDLAAGESRAVTWSARATAPGCLPVTLRPSLIVRNRALPGRETALLLYSNNPERVTACGPLYAAPLDDDIPARLLYHHQNGSGRPFAFRVEIENPNDVPAEVQVIEGMAGPTSNTVLVGHLAARRYGENWPADVGVVHALPPGRSRAIVHARVPNGDTVSGILGLRCLTGGRLRVRVVAEETPEPVERAVAAARVEPASEHVYPEPRKEVQARYRVGETWAFVPIGKKPISARDGNRGLQGNYGVVYDIAVRVENPTDRERTIQVALSADAGPARGVFWIEDRFVEAPELAADGLLASFRLAPGETRDLPIRTLPVAGSAYPARIVVRAAPLPPTPRPLLTDSPAAAPVEEGN